ncbi:MAG TPA: sigma-54-dependent Fis family transcriptional regulator [Candidatus Hydrogenedentes bacterium]|nr:sigma-54-dependent Fis family transcriptional regulator [Candidatus Hydrogenedentota bacterium]
MSTILAIDDEESIRQSYRVILEGEYDLALAEDGDKGLEYLDKHHVDLILLDLTMPGKSGEEVLQILQDQGNTTPVIVVTATNSITTAVQAMKFGAHDYIQKPFDVHDLLQNIERTLHEERDKQELKTLREAEFKGFESIIGQSTAFKEAISKAQQAMNVDSAVLITGESGTGKDLLARSIHNSGSRKDHAFVPLSCCAIPAQLVESELFGYEKGAFTGADKARIGKMKVADKGTLFLDEIGEMPVEAQAKLLRVLQDSCFYPVGSVKEVKVDIRVVCATNRNLPEAIQEGAFREDLYYRINVLNIEMPPLRKRREDVPLLVAHFMAKHAPRVNARTQNISPKAMNILSTYNWPGNIRELENTIERLLVYHGQEHTIQEEHLEPLFPESTAPEAGTSHSLSDYEGLPLYEATRQIEIHLITRALEQADYVQSRAAEVLGTTRRILKYKIDQLGIEAEKHA